MPLNYRIDAADRDNPVYFLDGREVDKEEFLRVVWSDSSFRGKDVRNL